MTNFHTTILKHTLGKDGASKALVNAVESYSKQYEDAGVKWTCPEPGVVEATFNFRDTVVEVRGEASDSELVMTVSVPKGAWIPAKLIGSLIIHNASKWLKGEQNA